VHCDLELCFNGAAGISTLTYLLTSVIPGFCATVNCTRIMPATYASAYKLTENQFRTLNITKSKSYRRRLCQRVGREPASISRDHLLLANGNEAAGSLSRESTCCAADHLYRSTGHPASTAAATHT